jgi:hypothetical protein
MDCVRIVGFLPRLKPWVSALQFYETGLRANATHGPESRVTGSCDEPSGAKRYLLSEDVPGVEDGVWTCAQPTLAGSDTCPFHTPEERPEDFDVTQAVLGIIDDVVD